MVEALVQQNTEVMPTLSVEELKALVASAPPEVQTEIAKALSQRGNADDAQVAAQVANVLSAQQAQDMAKQLPGHELAIEQQVAIESLATAQLEVKQKLDSGISADIVKAEAISEGNVAQAAVVATVAQENKEEQRQQQVADSDAKYRLEQGLAAPEQATVNPFAAALAGHDVAAQFQQAMNDYSQGASRPIDQGQAQGRGGRGGIG